MPRITDIKVLGKRAKNFLHIDRLRIRYIYEDYSQGEVFSQDMVYREGIDSVGVILFVIDKQRKIHVCTRRQIRPVLFCREQRGTPLPENRQKYLRAEECVAGSLHPDDAGKNEDGVRKRALQIAQREAGLPKNGYSVEHVTLLGAGFFPSLGQSMEKLYLVAIPLQKNTAMLTLGAEASPMDETATIEWRDFDEVLKQCQSGKIEDPKLEIGLYRLATAVGYLPQLRLWRDQLPKDYTRHYTRLQLPNIMPPEQIACWPSIQYNPKRKNPVDIEKINKVADSEIYGEGGFLYVDRYSLQNRYDDGSYSKHYCCDVLYRKGVDAVGLILYECSKKGIKVATVSQPRPVIYLRKEYDLAIPERLKSPMFIEAPAGGIEEGDKGGKGIKKRAYTEALEETGIAVTEKDFEFLGGGFFPSHGQSSEKIYMLSQHVKFDPRRKRREGDPPEKYLEVEDMEVKEILWSSHKGKIQDPKLEIGVRRLCYKLGYIPELNIYCTDLDKHRHRR